MRVNAGRSRDEVLAELTAEAEQTWGAERARALAATLETAAGALWRLAQAPLDVLEAEPDFIGGGTLRGGAA